MKSSNLNVFQGKSSILDFLDPDKSPPTPLVELSSELNPFRSQNVRIFAKLHNMLPLGNIKMLAARNMLEKGFESGKLKNTNSLIEYSSGNTILSLAIIARQMGIKNIKSLISHEAFESRINLLRFFGIQVGIHQEPTNPMKHDPKSGISKAEKLGEEKGWCCLGQYTDPANPEAHERWTGPDIWKQTSGKLTIFCSALGTTGTMVGTSKYLKRKSKSITTIGVSRIGGPVPGVRSTSRLNLIHFDWQKSIDQLEEVGIEESYTESLTLCRNGLLVGPSSGFTFAGLKKFLEKQITSNNLDKFKNKDGEIIAVFACYDGPFQYLSEYFDYVDRKEFPSIESEELLVYKKGQQSKI